MPAETVIANTTMVTCDPQRAIHYGAALAVANGVIAAVGQSAAVEARFPDAERVDGQREEIEVRNKIRPQSAPALARSAGFCDFLAV